MKIMKKVVLLVILMFVLLVNCYTVEVIDDTKGNSQGYPGGGDEWYTSYLFGIIESNKHSGTMSSCKNGATSRAVMHYSFLNVLAEVGLSCLTSGLGSPLIVTFRSNEIYCGEVKSEKKSTKSKDKSEYNRILVLKDGTILTDVKIEFLGESTLVTNKNGDKKIYKKEEIQSMK